MATIRVSTQDYEIIASILKEGAGMRRPFTFRELFDTLQNIGFSWGKKGQFKYDGKVLFVFRPGDKAHAAVSYARQDDLKRQMDSVFSWTKGSFEEDPGL